MVAASLIIAALLGTPFAPRAIVPVPSGAVAAVVQPAAFNPTATARAHQATITVTPTVAGTATTVVESTTGTVVATLGLSVPVTAGTPVLYTWPGAGAPDGTYGVRVTLMDAQGAISEAVTPVIVDSTPPAVAFGAPAPAQTKRGPVALRASTDDPSGASALRVDVLTQSGTLLGSTDLAVGPDGRSGAATWNLRLRKRLLLPGVFTLRAAAVDGAGNLGTSSTRLLRVSRPVTTRIIYRLPDAGKVVALTFDDCGSNRDMLRIVAAFKAARAQTTFFCNGVNVRDNVSADRAAVAAGDTIGGHTWSHPELPSLSYDEQVSQITGDVDAWWKAAKASPAPFFRPPYGLHDAATLRAAGAAGFAWLVLWDVDPSDYLTPPPAELIRHVVDKSRPGSIVVMHANANTAASVPAMIRAVRAKGLEPVSLEEMLGTAAYLAPSGG